MVDRDGILQVREERRQNQLREEFKARLFILGVTALLVSFAIFWLVEDAPVWVPMGVNGIGLVALGFYLFADGIKFK